ncbi:WEB family protein At5g55860 [Ricinus communis]|uniref:WEB family protein At5g55860 n=1 Tax=Ricinus communis TaxID=3988 RepID=UPI00201AD483|nr:WEB family protein At5g55860 [Ricinus communis]XP_015577049.2 WEB family protein At5g55860 [Ricinus communis]
MGAKERQNATDSPKVEVGEIDTSAPFQSVKDAVTLFGEGAFSGEKPAIKKTRPHSAERVLAKETQLHLAQKELSKLKDQVKNAETTKGQALVELEKAKRTVEDLSAKLRTVTELKDTAIRATEAAKSQAKQIEETKSGDASGSSGARKQDLESAREQYITVFTELDAAKQELWKIRQDCEASLEAKLAAFNQAAEAEHAAKANVEKVSELSKEISALQESIGQVKLASLQAQQEQAKIFAEKGVQKQSYKATLEASANKLLALKNEFDPELVFNLEKQLAETITEIDALQKQMENAKASDLDSVRTVTSELDGAKESLQKVAEEESSLRSLVESLKLELENVKKEHSELREKEAETESAAGNLHVKLRKSKAELEAAAAEESKTRGASEEMISTLHQLSSEAENAQQEAEEMKNKAEELKSEAEATRIALEEAEKKLRVALEEAEEAKLAETRALDQIKTLSERTNAARASTSESGANITISREEYEALSRKVGESESLAEMKVAAAMAQVEAVKASENEALNRFEAIQKEIDDMKAATQEAVKRAEMAEAAKKAVEGELRRWREREQKKAAETASRILAETEMSIESSPHHYRIQKQNPAPKNVIEVRKLDKEKNSASKKALLPNLSGIFQRKKNQIEGGPPSYLPGEKPV